MSSDDPNAPPARVALVTGAARGIGRATAERLSARARVLLVDLDPAVERVAEGLTAAGRRALAFVGDVGREADVDAAFRAVEAGLGPVDILVNNAGVGGPFHRADEVPSTEWEWILRTNLFSVYYFTRRALPGMVARGFGRIVNVASIQGLVGSARSSSYVASKHGVIGYTKCVAAEFGAHGITANALCPGYVATDLGIRDGVVDDYRAKVMARSPVPREASPAEMARIVDFLAADGAGYVNGASLVADGGISAHLGIT